MDEALARVAFRYVAAVEKQVACFRKHLANGGERRGVVVEGIFGKNSTAEKERPRAAMGEEVDRVDIASSIKGFGDLFDAVAFRVEQNDFDARIQAGDQQLPIGQTRIDERDLH